MRVSVVTAMVCVAELISAAARTHTTVAFAVGKGSEGLAYLAPEVGRGVEVALDARGLELGASEAATGRIDAVGGERVRLSASLRGHTVTVEGGLENLDSLAGDLAGRLSVVAVPRAARHVEGRKPLLARATPDVPREGPPSVAPVPASSPLVTPVSVVPAPVTPAPLTPDPVTAPAAASDPPSASFASAPVSYPPPYRAWPRGRVVAHAIPDPPSAFAGSGLSATQALYYFLERRLHYQVMPAGVGLAPSQIAAAEAWRMGARAVVMSRMESVEYLSSPIGPGVRCRLEVMVVRDGHVVFRRVADSGLPAPAPVNAGRGRELDPVFVAVSQALESLTGELTSVLSPPG